MTVQSESMRYVGSMQQVAYVRPVMYVEGRSGGLKAWDVRNGVMSFRVLADKCLDVSEFSFRGENLNFLSKPGLQGRGHYDTHGDEALRSIMGGFFFTCGAENICAPCTLDGMDYPMHGRLRTTPAEHMCGDAFWEGDEYHLKVSGEMREASLFGENIVLRRSIETVYGTSTVTLTDEFENQAFRDEPLMLLYHINFGWPFLNEHTRFYIPTGKVTPRDENSEGHEDRYDRMEPPKDNEPEYVFIHDLMTDDGGNTEVIAAHTNMGMKISWNVKNLPYFMQWKSIASGDYVVGLEPANSSVYGRPWHEERGTVHKLAPFAKEKNVLTFTVLSGEDAIDTAVAAFNKKYL